MRLRFSKNSILVFTILFLCFNLYSQENSTKKEEPEKNVIPEYEHILNSSASLHLFTYKDENIEKLLLHNKKNSPERSVIQNNGNKTKRFFYSEDMRLSCVEYWVTEKKVSESFLEKIVYYFYFNDGQKTEYSKKDFSIETKEYHLKNKTFTQVYYDAEGYVIEKNLYAIVGIDENTELKFTRNYKGISYPVRNEYSFTYKYDSAGQIIEESEIHNDYRNPQALRINRTNTRKNIYEYLRADCPPVTSFYENDILRMKTVYSSEKDYIQYIYFDNDNYVKVQVKNGKKVSELFYVDGKAYE